MNRPSTVTSAGAVDWSVTARNVAVPGCYKSVAGLSALTVWAQGRWETARIAGERVEQAEKMLVTARAAALALSVRHKAGKHCEGAHMAAFVVAFEVVLWLGRA